MMGIFECIRGSRATLRKGGLTIVVSVILLFAVFAYAFNRFLVLNTLQQFSTSVSSVASISAVEHLSTHGDHFFTPEDISTSGWTIFFGDLGSVWATDFDFVSPAGTLIYSTYRGPDAGQHVKDVDTANLFDEPTSIRKASVEMTEQSGSRYLYVVSFPLVDSNTFLGILEIYCDISPLFAQINYFQNLIWLMAGLFVILMTFLLLCVLWRQAKDLGIRGKKMEAIFEHSPMGIYTINARGEIDSFNPKMLELAGADNEKRIMGLNVFEMQSYKDIGLDKYFRLGLAGEPFHLETPYVSQTSGKPSYREYFGIPLQEQDSKKVDSLMLLVNDITQRKFLEERVARHAKYLEEEVDRRTKSIEMLSQQYKAIFDNSLAGIYVLQDDKMKLVNPAFLRIMGYDSVDEIVGQPWKKFIHPDDHKLVMASGMPLRQKGIGPARRYTPRAVRKDGSVIIVEMFSSPANFEGRPAIIGHFIDITEQTQISKAIERERDRATMYLDTASFLMVALDKDANIELINNHGAAMLDYQPEELIGKNWIDTCIPEKDRAEIWDVFRKIMGGDAVSREYFENYIVTRNNELKLCKFHNTVLRDEKLGISGILSSAEDVTEERREHDELVRRLGYENLLEDISRKAIKVDEDHLLSFLDDALKHIGPVMDVSRAYIFRYDLQNDTSDDLVEWVAEGIRPQIQRLQNVSASAFPWFNETLKSGQVVNVPDVEAMVHKKEQLLLKSIQVKSILMVPLITSGGIWGFIGFDHCLKAHVWSRNDVDLLFTLARTLTSVIERIEAEKHIKQLSALRNKFIQIMSHQLRTPLNAMRWNLESVLSEELGKLKPEQKEFMRVVYAANTEIIDRLETMLTAMDIEEGKVYINLEPTSFVSLWGSVMSEWKRKCELKDVTCDYIGQADDLPAMRIDQQKIRTVMSNLTDNAVIYTSPKGKIEVKISHTSDSVRFEVRDTGVGIPKAEQHQIFARFYRATNASQMKPDATGLGLSIAKYFVEQHGGKIGFESKEGKGSTFWFEIPLKPKETE
ncbi:MAG: PAS domain S-box protein [Patescibacteria group bacterium]|nr:PAS domain S-box protein [Patescibacteria group bacterium]